MGMHGRWSGEYEYDIEALPLVPPMSNGNSHEAKVAHRGHPLVTRRGDVRIRSASLCENDSMAKSGCYVERGVPHCPEMQAKEMRPGSTWHWSVSNDG
jgi:hypothetical protein